jgi:hypothetical protein
MPKALVYIVQSLCARGWLHRGNSREEGNTGQDCDVQPLLPTRPIHWVSGILALWLLPSDLDEAAFGLDTCNILFVLLASGRVVRIARLIFAGPGPGILGLVIGDGGLRFFRGLRWRGGVRRHY